MKKNHFTIIELMIVVSVIAILIGVLLPALEKARQAAIAISCLNNVKQCMLGIQSYGNDYNGILNTCENQNTSTGAGYGAWARLLTVSSYLPPNVVYCPLLRAEKTDTSRAKTLGILMAQNGWTKVWLEKEKIKNLFGKEICYWREPYFGYDLFRIKNPSRFPLLADTCSVNPDTGEKTGNRQFCPGTDAGDYKLSLHHRSTAVCGFPDGHAERLGISWFQAMQFKAVLVDYRPLVLE